MLADILTSSNPAPVIVLGMHRSGTSMLTGSLQLAGVHLGEVNNAAPFNKKGNKEHADIRALNDEILAANGASWRNPPARQARWGDKHRDEARAIIANFAMGPQPWGFKDPRTIWTIEGWLGLLQGARLVGVFRAPALVAESLAARQGGLYVAIDNGFELWTAYNAMLLALFEQYGFPLIEFTDPPSTLAQLPNIYGALRLAAPKAEFFSQELVNQRRNEVEVPGVARALYEQLRAARADWCRQAGG